MRTCARTSSKSDVMRLRTFVLSHSCNVKTTNTSTQNITQHQKHTSAPKKYLSSQNTPQQPHPKVMAKTEGYSHGGDAELYISASLLTLLLGLMFTALGIVNLFGNLLGPKGKIFIFEMDQVTKLFVEESSDQASR